MSFHRRFPLVLSLGVAWAMIAAGQPSPPAKLPAASPKGEWITTKAGDKTASAFPELQPPKLEFKPGEVTKDFSDYNRELGRLCPRIVGEMTPEPNEAMKIVPGDDTYRKLLKARLHQGRIELLKTNELLQVGKWDTVSLHQKLNCLEDMSNAATDLCGEDAKELAIWLREFVIMAKEMEQFINARVNMLQDPPLHLAVATRHRLKVESLLLKIKKPKEK